VGAASARSKLISCKLFIALRHRPWNPSARFCARSRSRISSDAKRPPARRGGRGRMTPPVDNVNDDQARPSSELRDVADLGAVLLRNSISRGAPWYENPNTTCWRTFLSAAFLAMRRRIGKPVPTASSIDCRSLCSMYDRISPVRQRGAQVSLDVAFAPSARSTKVCRPRSRPEVIQTSDGAPASRPRSAPLVRARAPPRGQRRCLRKAPRNIFGASLHLGGRGGPALMAR